MTSKRSCPSFTERHFLTAVSFWLALSFPASAQQFPFPQHVRYTAQTIKPAVVQVVLDQATTDFYDAWKARYLVNGCVTNEFYVHYSADWTPELTNAISVSEGQGYGMVITALMAGHDPAARIYFDGLFRFYTNHPSRLTPGLMGWQQVSPDCAAAPDGDDSATDGDLDIAYALLLADRQWGSDGQINYLDEAKKTIAAVMRGEINREIWSVRLGDWATPADKKFYYGTRPSDFMMDHFRAFQHATEDTNWSRVTDECYRVIAQIQSRFSPQTGLLPDFAVRLDTAPAPAAGHYLESRNDGEFSYNACRVPWRLATDFLISGDNRALVALNIMNGWIQTQTAADPAKINAGYRLATGKNLGHDTSLAFTAPFAVSAMVNPTNQIWLDKLWRHVASRKIGEDSYFGNSIKMICLIVLSGNWWTPQ